MSWDEGTSNTGSHDNLFLLSEESRERHYRKQAHHARHRAHERKAKATVSLVSMA
jgi:hypothetical protein